MPNKLDPAKHGSKEGSTSVIGKKSSTEKSSLSNLFRKSKAPAVAEIAVTSLGSPKMPKPTILQKNSKRVRFRIPLVEIINPTIIPKNKSDATQFSSFTPEPGCSRSNGFVDANEYLPRTNCFTKSYVDYIFCGSSSCMQDIVA